MITRILGSRLWFSERMKWIDLSGIVLLGFFLFIFGNSNYTLFDNSEAHYARVAQELSHSANQLSLTFNGDPWYVHPPLHFWLSETWCTLFGWTEWNLRFPEGLFGILGLLLVYQLGVRYFNRRTGLLAAAILGTSLYYTVMSRLAIFDTMLNTLILATTYYFLAYWTDPEKKTSNLIYAGIASGLAIMTKGPIGLIQPGLAALLFIFATKSWRQIQPKLFLIPAIALAIGAPWYIHQLVTHGLPFFNLALKDYTWYRFFGVVEQQTGHWYFYLPVLLGFFPWFTYIPISIYHAYKSKIWKAKTDTDLFMVFAWIFIIFTFIFFSIAKTKLPSYILGVFPFLALFIAHDILHLHDKWKTIVATITLPILTTLVTIGLTLSPPAIIRPEHLIYVLTSGIILSTGAWICAIVFIKHRIPAMSVLLITMVINTFYLVQITLPIAEIYKDQRYIVAALYNTPEPYRIISIDYFSPHVRYYLNKNIIDYKTLDEVPDAQFNSSTTAYVIIRTATMPQLNSLNIPYKIVTATPHITIIKLR